MELEIYHGEEKVLNLASRLSPEEQTHYLFTQGKKSDLYFALTESAEAARDAYREQEKTRDELLKAGDESWTSYVRSHYYPAYILWSADGTPSIKWAKWTKRNLGSFQQERDRKLGVGF